jgi:MscS family membrane protein
MLATFWRCLLFLVAVCPALLPAQSLGGLLSGKSATAAAQADDPLQRGTPRSAVRAFLQACHNQNYEQAAAYLDLQNVPSRERATQGPELAKRLAAILDRDSHFELSNLSDAPAGALAGRELLISVPGSSGNVSLYLQRESKQGVEIWLVAPDSVERLPETSAMDERSGLEKHLPPLLVSTQLLGTAAWVWFALALAMVILSLASRLLSRLVIAIFAPLVKRYDDSLHAYRLEAFIEPLRLLLSASVFRAVIEFLDPSALLRDYLLKGLTALFAFGAALLIMRIIDVISDQLQSRLNSRERALTYSVLPLGMRLLKVLVFCIFALFTLAGWGYNTNTILAGLGVGGLAVALAAQKTIENFFGGVSLITDRPVLVGDFCQFGGQVGTVEDIGLRSTRIRTLDRTLVTIPNSQFSTMTLENYSRRDQMWFHPALKLRRDTTSERVAQFMEKMTEILKNDPMVSLGGVPVRFMKIGEQSLQIDIFAYVLTADFDEFLRQQSKLLLEIMKAAEEAGISFALPIAESITITPPAAGPGDNAATGPSTTQITAQTPDG